MSVAEERELNECEAVIERGWQTFLEVGNALRRIKEKGLFRTYYHSFELYCRHRWQFGRAHAYRLIGAAQVVEKLSPIGDSSGPTHESQIRPLLGLDPELAAVAWHQALRAANGRPVTASDVRRAVAEVTCEAPRDEHKPAGPEGSIADVIAILKRVERALRKNKLNGETMTLLEDAKSQLLRILP